MLDSERIDEMNRPIVGTVQTSAMSTAIPEATRLVRVRRTRPAIAGPAGPVVTAGVDPVVVDATALIEPPTSRGEACGPGRSRPGSPAGRGTPRARTRAR